MSNLLVVTFEDTEQAGQAFEAIKKAKKERHVEIDDAAVIVKEKDGKVEIKGQLDKSVKRGAVGGGLLGLLLTGVFFPLAGLTVGVVSGAMLGKALDTGVDKKFVREVTETLKPGSSALFVIGKSDKPSVVIGILRPFQGTIYQTSVASETYEAMRDALQMKE